MFRSFAAAALLAASTNASNIYTEAYPKASWWMGFTFGISGMTD